MKLDKRIISRKFKIMYEVWITELEDLRVRLDDMGSSILDYQCMSYVLNDLTLNYDLQLAFIGSWRKGETFSL
jgi:hypothetical protein